MIQVLREYVEGDMQVTEYTRDGVSVSHTVRIPVHIEQPQLEPQPPVETMEQKIARLEQQVQSDNLIVMETLASIYEEIIGGA